MDDGVISRVKEVIARLGQTDQQFAQSIGLDKDKLSKALNHKRNFSSFELATIASVGSTTTDWILTGDSVGPLGMAARATGLAAGDLQSATEKLASRFARANAVLQRLGLRDPLPPLPTLDESGGFRREGWAGAEWATALIEPTLLFGPTADFQHHIETTFDVDIAGSGDLPAGCDGLAFQDDSIRLVILATTPVWTRRRFTMAHELGHLLFHDAEHNVLPEGVAPGGRNNDYAEKRANAFASALLMPEELVRGNIDGPITEEHFHRLVVQFKVSPSAMAVRLSQLGLVNGDQFNTFQRFTSRDSWATMNAADADEVRLASADIAPSRMLAAFMKAYAEGGISSKPLVELTGVDESVWRMLFHGAPTLTIAPMADSDEELEPAFAP